MNRKVMKAISVLLTMLIMIFIVANQVFAISTPDMNTFDNVDGDAKTVGIVSKVMATIINVIQVVGIGVAIIMLVYVAIKYITAAPEGKAEFKKSATAYIVGAIVLFGASGLLEIIKNFTDNNINNNA